MTFPPLTDEQRDDAEQRARQAAVEREHRRQRRLQRARTALSPDLLSVSPR